MSHFCEVEIEAKGSAETLVEALCQMKNRRGKLFTKEQIQIHEVRQSLHGFRGDVRPQKAHVIIPRKHVGGMANDIGFEKTATGTWKAHISEFDISHYGKKWQTELMSRWAVCNLEAEAKAKGWGYNFAFNESTQKAYVTVTQARSW